MINKRIALVTGANRGIGFEACRQLARNGFKVLLTSRNRETGKEAIEKLKKEKLDIAHHQLDVTDSESIKNIFNFVNKKFNRLDVLVNNAGILIDSNKKGINADIDTIKKTSDTNLYGSLIICQTFIPLMQKNNYGRIINISSGMGQLSNMGSGYLGYRISKTALNAVTRILSNELSGYNILINSMCPGWVRTDMGGPNATRSPEEAAETIVWLATLPKDGPTGGFFRDKKRIEW